MEVWMAQAILDQCDRWECNYDDRIVEITWWHISDRVALGIFSAKIALDVVVLLAPSAFFGATQIELARFCGDDAKTLRECGEVSSTTRFIRELVPIKPIQT